MCKNNKNYPSAALFSFFNFSSAYGSFIQILRMKEPFIGFILSRIALSIGVSAETIMTACCIYIPGLLHL